MKTGIYTTIFLVLFIFFNQGCAKRMNRFDSDYEKCEAIYFSQKKDDAKESITQFIRKWSNNDKQARDKMVDSPYVRTMAEAWLRLAGIHDFDKRDHDFDDAINHAIEYFDKIDDFAKSSEYIRNKKLILMKFLNGAELYHSPQWKKKGEGEGSQAEDVRS